MGSYSDKATLEAAFDDYRTAVNATESAINAAKMATNSAPTVAESLDALRNQEELRTDNKTGDELVKDADQTAKSIADNYNKARSATQVADASYKRIEAAYNKAKAQSGALKADPKAMAADLGDAQEMAASLLQLAAQSRVALEKTRRAEKEAAAANAAAQRNLTAIKDEASKLDAKYTEEVNAYLKYTEAVPTMFAKGARFIGPGITCSEQATSSLSDNDAIDLLKKMSDVNPSVYDYFTVDLKEKTQGTSEIKDVLGGRCPVTNVTIEDAVRQNTLITVEGGLLVQSFGRGPVTIRIDGLDIYSNSKCSSYITKMAGVQRINDLWFTNNAYNNPKAFIILTLIPHIQSSSGSLKTFSVFKGVLVRLTCNATVLPESSLGIGLGSYSLTALCVPVDTGTTYN